MPNSPALRRTFLAGLAVCVAACTPAPLPFARLAGLITSKHMDEVSGLAASRAHQDVLWAINDSGNPAQLHAISIRGKLLASFEVEGAKNIDWEDLASFDLAGKHYLLVADTGDNGGLRKSITLYVFEEPASLGNATLRPAWTIHARWPDGPRDCEAVAVDATAGKILLVSKKRNPPELFVLPLADPGKAWTEPRRIGRLAGIPPADPELQRSDAAMAKLFTQVTAADVSPDGNTLAVLTYGSVMFYRRTAGEDWSAAVARDPEAHDVPLIPQAEALAWSAGGGGLYATGEFNPAPIFYLTPEH